MAIISTYDLEHELDIDPNSVWLINTAPPSMQKNLICVQEIGDFYAYKNYFTTRECVDSFLIKVTVDGAGVLNYENQVSLIPAGYFYLIDCQKWHDYRTSPKEGSWHVLWLHFFGGNAKFYYESFLAHNNGSNVGKLSSNSNVYQIMQQLIEINRSDEMMPEMHFKSTSLITQLLTDIIECCITEKNFSSAPALLLSVKKFITDNYNQKISLEQMGKLHNLSSCYLQRLFKRYFGFSPLEYQLNLRIDKSKAELQNTTRFISEIAYDIGFESLNYFTRQFKKRVGITPGEYRRQWSGHKSNLS